METKENKYGTSCQSQETKVAAGKGSLRRTFVIITENVVKKRGNSVTTLPDYLQPCMAATERDGTRRARDYYY